MAIPELIPIGREPGYRTDTIGTYAGGQFYAAFHGVRPGDPAVEPYRPDRPTFWCTFLHLFDHDGHHRSTTIHRISDARRMSADERAAGERQLITMLDALNDREFGNIAIRPFRAELDGLVFALIDETGGHGESDWVELYPDRLGFCPPWDGTYST